MLVGGGGQTVVAGKRRGVQPGVLPLTREKDPLPRYEDVVKDDHGMTAVFRSGGGQEFHALGVAGHGARDGVVLARFGVVSRGDQHQLVREHGIADVQLATDDGNPLLGSIGDPDIELPVCLLRVLGVQLAVSLRIRHCGADAGVVLFTPGSVLPHVLRVLGAELGIHRLARIRDPVEGVDTGEPGEPDVAAHERLHDVSPPLQVLTGFGHLEGEGHLLAVLLHIEQRPVLRLLGHPELGGGALDTLLVAGGNVLDPLAVLVDHPPVPQALHILLRCSDHRSPLS